MKKVKIIVTLGPATNRESDLRKLKDGGVDFVRVNMSHSSNDDLKYFIALAKKVDIPFIIDTEGSQVRSGGVEGGSLRVEEGDEVRIHATEVTGDQYNVSLRPGYIVSQLEAGDLLHVDFESLVLRVSDTAAISEGYIKATALSSGALGSNKAVVIDPALPRKFNLPPLSEKDYQSIALGLGENIKYIAASFMRSGESVDTVREATKHSMKIVSKIECIDALEHLDEIIEKSDFLLIDRGDLSKEIPIEKIPFAQKIILAHARNKNKEVFVATNLLETMVEKSKPTRAEAHDVIATVLDGAAGVTLSAETAIGKYPMECVAMMKRLLEQAALAPDRNHSYAADDELIRRLERSHYLLNREVSSPLVLPHGRTLVDRVLREIPDRAYVASLPTIKLDQNAQMDVEQIAIGTFSPLEGFMTRYELESVLDTMRLPNGIVWTVPVILDVSQREAGNISVGDIVALADDDGVMALLHIGDKYIFDKKDLCEKLYGTNSREHPGVQWIHSLRPVFLGGKVDLIRRRKSEHKEYELTPRQARRLFEERTWSKVIGFHTRNVIHRSHEFMQIAALENERGDGLFVHPVIGKKKAGDFRSAYIIKSYEHMMKHFYPKDRVVFAVFSTFSRYAGPREAIFTALCRKNFGCSHFIVGRDHTGVGEFYKPHASHDIFDQFPDLGIKAVKFDTVFYSKKLGRHVHGKDFPDHDERDKLYLSGTEARRIFERGGEPQGWFMRPEISKIITDARTNGEEIFIHPVRSKPRRDVGATAVSPKERGRTSNEVGEKQAGMVIWFTGLSGSGKTTLANRLAGELVGLGKRVELIDGDILRASAHSRLSFTRDGIKENNRLAAFIAKEKLADNDFVAVSIISPFSEDRTAARAALGGSFTEVFVDAPLALCAARDPKGLYKKVAAGEISDFIGVSPDLPYQRPENPDLHLRTDLWSEEQCLKRILGFMKEKGRL